MNRRLHRNTSEHSQQSVAVRELIGHECDYDTSTSSWAAFDLRMSEQFAELEERFQRYFTPVAIRQGLGR